MFLSAIVMACGKGERFGSNKLMAKLKGKELIRYTLDALPAELFSEILVVTKYKEIMDLVTEYPAPFFGIYTDDPEGTGCDDTLRCAQSFLKQRWLHVCRSRSTTETKKLPAKTDCPLPAISPKRGGAFCCSELSGEKGKSGHLSKIVL